MIPSRPHQKATTSFSQTIQPNDARDFTQHDCKLFALVSEPPVYWIFIRQAHTDPFLTDVSFSHDYF